ncbi:MAG: FAD-binding oxidoreductase [Chloroflexota bacterium]
MNKSNYWQKTINKPEFKQENLPENTEILVIGAGFTGLSAAYTLARQNIRVVVLEENSVGWGASSRNGGMVLTGMKLGVETLIKKYGIERARRMFALSLDALNNVETLVQEEKINCSFARCGHFEAAWKPAHFDGYSRSAELLEKDFNHKVKIISRTHQRQEIGSDMYYGGMLDEKSAGINPAQFVFGLSAAADRQGVKMMENTMALGVEKYAGGYQVNTSRGKIKAQKIIFGTSGYSGTVFPYLQKRIAPIGSYIIATSPLPAELVKELIPNNRMIFDSKHYLYYFRITPDNRMLFGGRAVFKSETPSAIEQSAPILRKSMLEVFPGLREFPVEYVWGGSLDFAVDSMPHTGHVDGLYYSIGYAGHGAAFAVQLGKMVADKAIGKDVDDPLDQLPFLKFPFNFGKSGYMPLAGLYYKILDLIS